MPITLGSGEHRYRVVENWAKLPDGWKLTDVASVAVDSKDRVYVFNRGTHPMIVFDRDGNFIKSWGEGLFRRAHGLHIDAHDNLYCTDDGDHTVRKCSVNGTVQMTIGIPDKPAPFMSGEPFHRCTHTALSPKGEIYVSDGYGNARVHKYAPDGKLIKSWGEPGSDPGQFNIVHNISTDADGQEHLAIGGALAHRVVAVVGAIKTVVRVNVQPMRAAKQAFAPTPDEIAVAIQHDHRVLTAIEDIDTVLAVDRNRCDIGELPAVRQLRPVFHHAVAVFTRAENDRHLFSSLGKRHSATVSEPPWARSRLRAS